MSLISEMEACAQAERDAVKRGRTVPCETCGAPVLITEPEGTEFSKIKARHDYCEEFKNV